MDNIALIGRDKTALIVIDMINDFVSGTLGCERALKIVEPVSRLCTLAREHDIPVIYTCDAHLPSIDKEIMLWGEHAMVGTKGADVIPELSPHDNDYMITKRRYSAFFQTGLKLLLDELGVGRLILCGLQAHLCVQHTCADAFQWGYGITIPKDCTDAVTARCYAQAIAYMQETYGANITTVDKLAESLA
ncbi:MAG: cysteine hydrolase [Coriobacteriales bacterium]|jgi:nicotinamidase-related amidase|nr:cysteine hydrolase [Coriobacteriales bacterium]